MQAESFNSIGVQMNRKAAISVVIALTMATGQFSFAQGNNNRNERGDNERGDSQRGYNERGDNEGRQQDRHATVAYQHDSRDFGRSHNQERSKGRGAGPNHEYYRGDRLPAEYRNRQYVVDDWRGHNLSAPPHGYHWVQSGNDYILIAITTGIIAALLLGH
jgi:Ni/Co efflux regulator RcnB